MQERVRTIRLYGYLGAKFGRTHSYVISSARDAIRALIAMVPGFEKELMTSQDRGVRYAVFVGNRNITEAQLEHPSGRDDIRIAPILVGSKSGGLFSIITGIALVVGAVALGPIGMGAGAWLSGSVAMGMGMVGVSLALGGLAQLISPQQPTPQQSLQSYNFNGAQNNAYQGGPVPLLYGRMRIGSTVISEGLLAQDGTAQLVGGHYVATN